MSFGFTCGAQKWIEGTHFRANSSKTGKNTDLEYTGQMTLPYAGRTTTHGRRDFGALSFSLGSMNSLRS
jgi:hypothetical protein